jgi:predicted secreted hydrolase
VRLPHARRRGAAIAAVALIVAGCSTGPILANPPISYPPPPTPSARPTVPSDPVPIELPRDDGPHDRLTEWWYYTGHLETATGRRFGFEAVVFRAERGSVPAAWASHLALTDEEGGTFHYAQRSEVGPGADRSPRDGAGVPTGFDLNVAGLNPELIAAGAPVLAANPWRLAGSNGRDTIEAALTADEAAAADAAFGLRLDLRSTKPPAFHDTDGFIDFGPAGASYYYSRTRLAATGELELDGERFEVTGIAWFDHQWGDFVSVGGGGWDWFAINLDDATDLTFSVVRDAAGEPAVRYGTRIDADGTVTRIDSSGFEVRSSGDWTSPRTGTSYPAGWQITVFEPRLVIELVPTVDDQELDTRATTGVAYWEGSQFVAAARSPSNFDVTGGQAYVEITRY